MRVKKKVIIEKECNIEFSGATLLSADEASTLLTKQEKNYEKYWWLRTPGSHSIYACCIGHNGNVRHYGNNIHNYTNIRPALIISKLGDFKVGDYFSIGEYEFKIISPELAWLHKQDIGNSIFGETNDYESSKVKIYVDKWYESIIPTIE